MGLSYLNGTHLEYTAEIIKELRAQGSGDQMVLVGGTIAKADIPRLKALGVAEVFLAGTSLDTAIEFVRQNCRIEK